MKVDLVGLGDSVFRNHLPQGLDNLMRLYTFIKEPTDLLQSFCNVLSQKFMDAGFERRNPIHRPLGSRQFRQIRVIDTKGLSSGVLNTKPTLRHLHQHRVPRFDARDLCEKFKDIVWAKGVHLDRVCISELKPKDIAEDGQRVGTQYHDIVRIPLPGVTWEPRSFEYLRIPHRWATAETQGRDRA